MSVILVFLRQKNNKLQQAVTSAAQELRSNMAFKKCDDVRGGNPWQGGSLHLNLPS